MGRSLKNVGWEITPFTESAEAQKFYAWKEEARGKVSNARRVGVDNTVFCSAITGAASLFINPFFGAFTLIWTGIPLLRGVGNWRASTHLTRAIDARAKLIESLYYLKQVEAGIKKQHQDLVSAPQNQKQSVALACVEQWKQRKDLFKKMDLETLDAETVQRLEKTRAAVVKPANAKQLDALLKECVGRNGSLTALIQEQEDNINRNARYYNYWVRII